MHIKPRGKKIELNSAAFIGVAVCAFLMAWIPREVLSSKIQGLSSSKIKGAQRSSATLLHPPSVVEVDRFAASSSATLLHPPSVVEGDRFAASIGRSGASTEGVIAASSSGDEVADPHNDKVTDPHSSLEATSEKDNASQGLSPDAGLEVVEINPASAIAQDAASEAQSTGAGSEFPFTFRPQLPCTNGADCSKKLLKVAQKGVHGLRYTGSKVRDWLYPNWWTQKPTRWGRFKNAGWSTLTNLGSASHKNQKGHKNQKDQKGGKKNPSNAATEPKGQKDPFSIPPSLSSLPPRHSSHSLDPLKIKKKDSEKVQKEDQRDLGSAKNSIPQFILEKAQALDSDSRRLAKGFFNQQGRKRLDSNTAGSNQASYYQGNYQAEALDLDWRERLNRITAGEKGHDYHAVASAAASEGISR